MLHLTAFHLYPQSPLSPLPLSLHLLPFTLHLRLRSLVSLETALCARIWAPHPLYETRACRISNTKYWQWHCTRCDVFTAHLLKTTISNVQKIFGFVSAKSITMCLNSVMVRTIQEDTAQQRSIVLQLMKWRKCYALLLAQHRSYTMSHLSREHQPFIAWLVNLKSSSIPFWSQSATQQIIPNSEARLSAYFQFARMKNDVNYQRQLLLSELLLSLCGIKEVIVF